MGETMDVWIFSAKITEQCANLTMAFRTNYHAYVGGSSMGIGRRIIGFC